MVAQDPVPCKHGRPECQCASNLAFTVLVNSDGANGVLYEIGTNTAGWSYGDPAVGNISISPGTSARNFQPMIGTPIPFNDPYAQPGSLFHPPEATCTEHAVDPETIREHDDGLVGLCAVCAASVLIPRVPGGVSFERAGKLVGRAMSLDEEDDSVGELMAELNLLEADVKKEIARYKRTLGMVKIARDVVHNRAVQDAKASIE